MKPLIYKNIWKGLLDHFSKWKWHIKVLWTISLLAVLVYSLYFRFHNSFSTSASWPTTSAIIENSNFKSGFRESDFGAYTQTLCFLEYVYEIRSIKYRHTDQIDLGANISKGTAALTADKFKKGQTIQIRYSPNDPNIHYIDDLYSTQERFSWGPIVLLSIFSILSIYMCFNHVDKKTTKRNMPYKKATDLPWDKLFREADRVIRQTIAELPQDLKVHAEKIPFILEKWPAKPGVLGTYHGFTHKEVSDQLGPIFVYLGTIYEYCEKNEEQFSREVRKTWLHEFGHYLGWEEHEVEKFGL
jgi:predicted Zn-dependent protease with MMP-like domain